MPKRRKDVIFFDAPPVISAWGSAGGKKEGEGPLASAFDYLTQDAAFADENCANWEQAESMLQQKAAGICLRKAGIAAKDVDLTFAGDLQAQCTASNYTLRTLATPFAGLYGACSTMTEALCLGAAFAAAGLGRQILAMTSSHFCAAERQFLPAAGAGAGGRADFVRHLWPGAGLRRDRHQQHGRRHDARSRQHAAALF